MRALLKLVAVCAALGANVSVAAPATGAEGGIDPEADKILKSMSSYLAKTKVFSVKADVATEILLKDGQKLQLCSSQTIVIRRPAEFRIQIKGRVADAELTFDGKTVTLYSKKRNAFIQREVQGGIDNAIGAMELETGITATGADLLLPNSYESLSSGVLGSRYVGTSYVGGVECHHLAFRKDDVDWQLWVQTGDRPLPMKYVITTKWLTSAPQYELTLRDWNTSPQIQDKQFTFSAPAGAKKLESIPTEEIDEIPNAKEAK